MVNEFYQPTVVSKLLSIFQIMALLELPSITCTTGRNKIIHGHYMSQWYKTTDLCSNTDSNTVIFTDSSYYVHGSYYVYQRYRKCKGVNKKH